MSSEEIDAWLGRQTHHGTMWITDEPFCGDTDIDVVWPVLWDGSHVFLEDHVPGTFTSHGHLLDWLNAILRG